MDIPKIKELAKIAHEKRACFRNLGIVSIATDPEDQEAQTIEYEAARAEMYEADKKLFTEQNRC